MSATGLAQPNDKALTVTLEVTNHERNLQIPIDDLASGLGVHVTWSAAAGTRSAAAPKEGPAAASKAKEGPTAAVATGKTEGKAEGKTEGKTEGKAVGKTEGKTEGKAVPLGVAPTAGQLWAKKLPGGAAAALLINHSPQVRSPTFSRLLSPSPAISRHSRLLLPSHLLPPSHAFHSSSTTRPSRSPTCSTRRAST